MGKLSAGDFEDLYDQLARPLLLTLARRTLDAEVALDLWAETWAAAYAGLHRFRGGSTGEAEAWVRGIALKQYAMYVRRGTAERRALQRLGLERPSLDDDDLAEIERQAGIDELRGRVAAGLERLTADQREALRLRVVEELPYADVARRLRVSEPTARARVSRGLRALGDVLELTTSPDAGAL
jgi:RNA polymerase sigma factor (sigma-70 family)